MFPKDAYLPPYPHTCSLCFKWGHCLGPNFQEAIRKAYNQVVHWRRNIFKRKSREDGCQRAWRAHPSLRSIRRYKNTRICGYDCGHGLAIPQPTNPPLTIESKRACQLHRKTHEALTGRQCWWPAEGRADNPTLLTRQKIWGTTGQMFFQTHDGGQSSSSPSPDH